MSSETVPRSAGAECADGPAGDRPSVTASSERHSVSDLVRSYSDNSEGQKRGRSESGDPAPAGKRGAREPSGEVGRSPAALGSRNLREHLETTIDSLETRMMASLSRDFHEIRETLSAEIARLNDRLADLEKHVEEKDNVIAELTDELRESRSEVSALQARVEDAEVNSRLPCLVLSGAAMASRHAPRPGPPLPTDRATAGAAAAGQGQAAVTSRPAGGQVGTGPGGSAPGAGGDRRGARGAVAGDWEEREDVDALVVNTLNRSMPGLNMSASDIDRAHRLPGPNNRVIVRFVRSGQGSVRDQVFSRRLELRGRDLFVNESLTRLRSQIFRSLLAVKRERRIYTVYSRGGHVFYKEKQHGVGKRVDSLQRVREMGFTVIER